MKPVYIVAKYNIHVSLQLYNISFYIIVEIWMFSVENIEIMTTKFFFKIAWATRPQQERHALREKA